MVRTVLAEEILKVSINNVAKHKSYSVGLVLGQSKHSELKDYIIHIVETPLRSHASEFRARIDCQYLELEIRAWKPHVVTQHAMQVTRMLSGGFDVLGLYICTIDETITTSELAHAKLLLSSIHQSLTAGDFYVNSIGSEYLLLHISCVPQKVTCKTLNAMSSLATVKPVDFKFVSEPVKWTRLNCQLAVDLHIPQCKENSKLSLIHQFKLGLKPVCDQIEKALATFDGKLKPNDELLDPISVKTKRGAKYKVDVETNLSKNCIDVDLYVDLGSSTNPELVMAECDVAMKLSGTLVGRTFVPAKCTAEEGLKFLKFDLLRSLLTRCEIHCDDLLVNGEEDKDLDKILVHELPRRVFAPLPSVDITMSDYLFAGETAKNAVDAFDELLALSLDRNDIEDGCERFTDSDNFTFPVMEQEDLGVQTEEMLPVKSSKSCNSTCLFFSVSVAVLAAAVSFYVVNP
ncbi:hypothetical protein CHUAL_000211 [Chamberlinius hualienensis]